MQISAGALHAPLIIDFGQEDDSSRVVAIVMTDERELLSSAAARHNK